LPQYSVQSSDRAPLAPHNFADVTRDECLGEDKADEAVKTIADREPIARH
jgi:hypothetical protein